MGGDRLTPHETRGRAPVRRPRARRRGLTPGAVQGDESCLTELMRRGLAPSEAEAALRRLAGELGPLDAGQVSPERLEALVEDHRRSARAALERPYLAVDRRRDVAYLDFAPGLSDPRRSVELDGRRAWGADASGRLLWIELRCVSRGVEVAGLPEPRLVRRALQRLAEAEGWSESAAR